MPKPRTDISLDRLKELLTYDPIEGVFTWRVTNSNRSPAGSKAGSLRKRGDIGIRLDGVEYKAHRLAWLYVKGEWPVDQVDHEDLDPTNNHWGNLRLADNAQNNTNRRAQSNNKFGIKNVSYYPTSSRNPNRLQRRPYVAWTCVGGSRRKYVGSYETAEEAHAAAIEAGEKQYGQFYRAS